MNRIHHIKTDLKRKTLFDQSDRCKKTFGEIQHHSRGRLSKLGREVSVFNPVNDAY